MEDRKHFVSLDILKFICAIMIVFHHFQQVFEIRFSFINFSGGKFYFGYLVELFFVISGFLSGLGKKKTKEKSFLSYFISRYLKFLPMCTISITAILFLDAVNYLIYGVILTEDGIGVWKVFTNYTLTFSGTFFGSDILGFNNPLWYVCVLLQCYIIYFIVVKSAKEDRTLYIFALICLSSYWLMSNRGLALTWIPSTYFELFRGCTAYFLGVLMYEGYVSLDGKQSFKKSIFIVCTFILLLLSLLAFFCL